MQLGTESERKFCGLLCIVHKMAWIFLYKLEPEVFFLNVNFNVLGKKVQMIMAGGNLSIL